MRQRDSSIGQGPRTDEAGWKPDAAAFALLLGVFAAWQAITGVQQGRDFVTYFSYYFQIFLPQPVDHFLMLYRTPGTPLFFGLLDSLGGVRLVVYALATLFAGSLTLLFRAVRLLWGQPMAWALLTVLSLVSSYNGVWHTVASESPFCAGVAVLAAASLSAFSRPTAWRWAGLGLICFALAMIRPSGQLTGLLGLAALTLPDLSWRSRGRLLAAFLIPFLTLTAAWTAHNGLRYGQFTVARGGAAIVPAYRVFLWERMMRPDDGPASAALARAVETDLLPRPEYRERKVDLELFFSAGDSFMFGDLIALSDRAFGWETAYAPLRAAALEAVARDPSRYALGVARTLWLVFSSSEHEVFAKSRALWPEPENVRRHKRELGLDNPALPGNVEILERSSVYWLSSGSGRFQADAATVRAVRERERDALQRYPDFWKGMNFHPWALAIWTKLAALSSWFFLLAPLGVLCALDATPRGRATLWLWCLSWLILTGTYLGTDAVIQFRNPFDPVFVLAALAGLGKVDGLLSFFRRFFSRSIA